MRIDRLVLHNFKKYSEVTFDFPRSQSDPLNTGSFHVLIGENGSGKTTILDALAVAIGVWLEQKPDSSLANSHRRLKKEDKRLVGRMEGDRTLFQRVQETMSVNVSGEILNHTDVTWGQELATGKTKVSNAASKSVLRNIKSAYERIGMGEKVLLPVICYYGAGRAWLAHNEREKAKAKSNGPANRWEAFYDCLNERIRVSDLVHWFMQEHIEMGNRQGSPRPGFEVVRHAVLSFVPGADRIWYDSDTKDIAISIYGNAQPLGNLSAGQRVMLSLVADLAIKMVTQNNFLVPPDTVGLDNQTLLTVLSQSPGVVLIDELDVHLHPKWQRQVCNKLREIFPKVQFFGTTHSPQVIGSINPHDIIHLLPDGTYDVPGQSYGMDTNWILTVLMDADNVDPLIKDRIESIFNLITKKHLEDAHREVVELRQEIGPSEILQRAASTIERMRILGR